MCSAIVSSPLYKTEPLQPNGSSQQRLEPVVYRFSRPKNPRPDCPDRTSQGLGNFLETQTFALPQRDCGTQIFRQSFDHLEHRHLDLVLEQQALRCGIVAQLRCGFILFGVLYVDVDVYWSASLIDQIFLRRIDGNTVLPRVKNTHNTKLRE